jgi:hypothetical protein
MFCPLTSKFDIYVVRFSICFLCLKLTNQDNIVRKIEVKKWVFYYILFAFPMWFVFLDYEFLIFNVIEGICILETFLTIPAVKPEIHQFEFSLLIRQNVKSYVVV